MIGRIDPANINKDDTCRYRLRLDRYVLYFHRKGRDSFDILHMCDLVNIQGDGKFFTFEVAKDCQLSVLSKGSERFRLEVSNRKGLELTHMIIKTRRLYQFIYGKYPVTGTVEYLLTTEFTEVKETILVLMDCTSQCVLGVVEGNGAAVCVRIPTYSGAFAYHSEKEGLIVAYVFTRDLIAGALSSKREHLFPLYPNPRYWKKLLSKEVHDRFLLHALGLVSEGDPNSGTVGGGDQPLPHHPNLIGWQLLQFRDLSAPSSREIALLPPAASIPTENDPSAPSRDHPSILFTMNIHIHHHVSSFITIQDMAPFKANNPNFTHHPLLLACARASKQALASFDTWVERTGPVAKTAHVSAKHSTRLCIIMARVVKELWETVLLHCVCHGESEEGLAIVQVIERAVFAEAFERLLALYVDDMPVDPKGLHGRWADLQANSTLQSLGVEEVYRDCDLWPAIRQLASFFNQKSPSDMLVALCETFKMIQQQCSACLEKGGNIKPVGADDLFPLTIYVASKADWEFVYRLPAACHMIEHYKTLSVSFHEPYSPFFEMGQFAYAHTTILAAFYELYKELPKMTAS